MNYWLTQSSTKSKSRENYLRILLRTAQDFLLHEYSRSSLKHQQLALCHLSKLKMEQFGAHKSELLRVLDLPQLPLHTNAAETDIP